MGPQPLGGCLPVALAAQNADAKQICRKLVAVASENDCLSTVKLQSLLPDPDDHVT